MLKVSPIRKMVCPEGRFTGVPCVFLDFLSEEGEEIEVNLLLEKILKFSKLPHILIRGNISSQPEIVTIIRGLGSKGKLVIFVTASSESIETVRMVRNLHLMLTGTPPTSEENSVSVVSLGLLKEEDELKLKLETIEDYHNVKEYLKSKTISKSTIIFGVGNDLESDEAFWEEYLKDAEYFTFKQKIGMKLNI